MPLNWFNQECLFWNLKTPPWVNKRVDSTETHHITATIKFKNPRTSVVRNTTDCKNNLKFKQLVLFFFNLSAQLKIPCLPALDWLSLIHHREREPRVFVHSLDVAACQKVFLCCAISASREMAMIMLLKRKRELFPYVFIVGGWTAHLWLLWLREKCTCSRECELGGIWAVLRLRKPENCPKLLGNIEEAERMERRGSRLKFSSKFLFLTISTHGKRKVN